MTLLANFLTILRIVAIPFIIYTFFMEDVLFGAQIALWLFIIASITDWLDGKIARKFNAGSKFGTMLDPIADKLLVGIVLILLVYDRQPSIINGAVMPRADLLPVVIIIGREILVSGLREFLASEGIRMPVTKLAKWKTTFQFIALISLLAAPVVGAFTLGNVEIPLQHIGQITLWVAAVLTFITGWQYFRHTIREAFGGKSFLQIKVVDSEENIEPENTGITETPKE